MTQISGYSSAAGSLGTPARAPVNETAQSDERAQLATAAKAFEAIFVRQMLSTMRQASLGDDLSGSSAVDQFQEMSDARMAESLSKQGNLGIADLILGQLEKKS